MSNLGPQFDGIAQTEGIATAYKLGKIRDRQQGVVQSRTAPGRRPLQQGGAALSSRTSGVRKMTATELSETLVHHYGRAGLKVSNN